MNARRNPFVPVRGRILRDNEDLVSAAGVIPPVSPEVQAIEHALDRMTDPELQLAERDYAVELHKKPHPLFPEPLA